MEFTHGFLRPESAGAIAGIVMLALLVWVMGGKGKPPRVQSGTTRMRATKKVGIQGPIRKS